MSENLAWKDWPTSSIAHVKTPTGFSAVAVYAPDEYCNQWTAQAELLDESYRQMKFSGLLQGGDSRHNAKMVAVKALEEL